MEVIGDRYFLTLTCPNCNRTHNDVCYAPTCEITEHTCICGFITNLEELTGISYEVASNIEEIREIIDDMRGKKDGTNRS